MLRFHQSACHGVCLVAGHVGDVRCFLVRALPSGVVVVVLVGVTIHEVKVDFPCVIMWLPWRTALSAAALVPLVVSAASSTSALVPLVGAEASTAASMGLWVEVGVRSGSYTSTAASIWLLVSAEWLATLPIMVGAASLAPWALSFASFLACKVLLLIRWRLLRGWNVDSCGRQNERLGLRDELCGLYRRRWCLILLWRWCVRLWMW